MTDTAQDTRIWAQWRPLPVPVVSASLLLLPSGSEDSTREISVLSQRGQGQVSEVSVALLRISHVASHIQSQRAHGKVLKAVHSAWNLSVCLWGGGGQSIRDR